MYKNSTFSPDERARDLLSKMTLDEKIDQMVFFPNLAAVAGDAAAEKDLPSRCGAFGNLGNLENTQALDIMQDYFLNKTRLGIPLIMAFESLHGFYHPKATAFPQCAGLGGSFNPSLIYEMAKIIGREARAVGVRQVFAPNVDIPRDPRWGRLQEAYGEDPYLVAAMGEQYVKGVQEEGVAATAKHFIAYGVPEGGINLTPAHVGEREIREVMLEPFQSCVNAGVKSIMPSYNEVDGEPVHASRKLLGNILRDEMGFDGTMISDWSAVRMLHDFHYVAKDFLEAGKMALNAGINIEAPEPKGYGEAFRDAAKNGDIDIALIDSAVLKILKLKFELGLFENPYATGEEMNTAAAKELALKLDEQSILLLENDGILPLDENKIGRVAVIGNNAKHSFMGDYIAETKGYVDFYSGIKNRLGEDRVLYSRGCGHLSYTDDMIAEAVETARKADTIMLVLGDSTDGGGGVGGGGFKDLEITCGEGYDTHTLDFTSSQKKLFDEIVALGKPTLLILYAGRPFTIKEDVDKVNAFMFSWGGGEQSGTAFANLIFGDKTPSAKLSFSMPQSTGHIPCYYNYKMSARGNFYKRPGTPGAPGRDYVSASPAPWYPFGYGLSYTTLKYTDLSAKVKDGKVYVSVRVENKGSYEIDESVLLFVRMMYCPTTPFIKKLRKFSKVNLRPGDSKTVDFILTDEDFTYIDENMKTIVNRGKHIIMISDLECTIEI